MLSMQELDSYVKACEKCELYKNRNHSVLGDGIESADIMFIGEAPGADEDRIGRPFVGKAGQLLDKALEALQFNRNENFYICNVCKCRPPNNRTPDDTEAEACLPYLRYQVAIIKPRIIVCLGATAVRHTLGKEYKVSAIRGKWFERKGYYFIATFHPAALLRDESKKPLFWSDLKKVKEKYNEILLNKRV